MAKSFSWVLREPAEENIPLYVIFVDTETKVVSEREGVEQIALLLACYEVWKVNVNGQADTMVEMGVFTETGSFYDLVREFLPCRAVAHNWQFDASVLGIGKRSNMLGFGYEIDFPRSILPAKAGGFAPFFVKLDFGNDEYCELICNTNFYKLPLQMLGGKDIPKLDMPDVDDIEGMTKYCQRDVEILRRAWFELFDISQELGGTTAGFTASMLANRVYRKRFLPHGIRIQGSKHIPMASEAEQDGYKGGRTDTFYRGKPAEGKTIYKYDVNSLYPSVMLNNVPIRYMQAVSENTLMDDLDYGGGGQASDIQYLAFANIEIPEEHRYSFIALEGIKHEDGRLIFPIGSYSTWIWQPMLNIAHKQGWLKGIHRAFAYEAYPAFKDYVEYIYARRLEYRERGEEGKEMLAKLMMNSLYGKFGQRQSDRWEEVDPRSDEYYVMSGHIEGDNIFERIEGEYIEGEWADYMQNGDRLFKIAVTPNPPPTGGSVLSIAGYITSAARSVLWDGLRQAMDVGGELYMCDTDSIITDTPLPERLVDPKRLGAWKLEGTSPANECDFRAPKHYAFSDKWRIKGVRNPDAGENFKQKQFPKFTSDLLSTQEGRQRRLQGNAEIVTMKKVVKGKNEKRQVVAEHCPTYPFKV